MRRPSRTMEPAAIARISRRDSRTEEAPGERPGTKQAYCDGLAAEARRLRQLQLKTEAQADRFKPKPGVSIARAELLRKEALSRAAKYQAEFHRTIDALMNADEFDQAMAILREHRRHRQTVYLMGPHFWG